MNALLLLLTACQTPDPLAVDQAPPASLVLDVPALFSLEEATLTVTGAPAGAEVVVFFSTASSGSVACPRAMRPICLDLYAPAEVLARGRADVRGVFSPTVTIPVHLTHQTVSVQAVTRVGRHGGVSGVEQELVLPSWCYGDDGCPTDQHCSVSDGVCNPDPTCPACTVCTGACVDDLIWCMSSHSCPAGTACSTEAGDCLTPPWCNDPNVACPAVCYGTCGGGAVR